MTARAALATTLAIVLATGTACSDDDDPDAANPTTTVATTPIEPTEHDLGIEPYAPLAAFDAVWTIGNAGDPAALRAPAVVRLDPDARTEHDVALGIEPRPIGPADGSWFGGLAADDSYLYVVVDRALVRV
ncbi:MAG TPA: hypothetical protein VFZ83_11250, partial [Acidimicrobiia bacterium]|nr:hypothetical protein [Acidimicrobiia bacterium]